MKEREIIHIIIAILILAVVISFTELITGNPSFFGISLLFSAIIILVHVFSKKLVGSWLDVSVEHKVWFWRRYWFKPGWHLEKAAPVGAILPLIISAFSLGYLKLMTILTYETSVLKRRVAKRHGYYSYTEMTDFHMALIGGSGILAVLLLSFISYWFQPLEELARMAAFYAFWNLIPVSTLDGTHIMFGSRLIWTILFVVAVIFTVFAILLGLI